MPLNSGRGGLIARSLLPAFLRPVFVTKLPRRDAGLVLKNRAEVLDIAEPRAIRDLREREVRVREEFLHPENLHAGDFLVRAAAEMALEAPFQQAAGKSRIPHDVIDTNP